MKDAKASPRDKHTKPPKRDVRSSDKATPNTRQRSRAKSHHVRSKSARREPAANTTSARLLLFNKPYQVLSQFKSESHQSLDAYIAAPGFHVCGRLDYDSEGLLLLTNNGALQNKISHPKFKLWKRYYAQVEGQVDSAALRALERGIELKDGMTLPAKARAIDSPESTLWRRFPPIRYRKDIPTSWIELSIQEGKNRQVRRMTAHVGYPTLRLIRVSIGNWSVENLAPGMLRSEFI